MSKFEKGDIVVGNSRANSYAYTKQGWTGEVINSSGLLPSGMFRARGLPGQYTGEFDLEELSFDLSAVAPKKVASRTKIASVKISASKAYPQAFMEDIEVVIADCENYYDITTEEYIDQRGTITEYLGWQPDDGCWNMLVRMSDGETLEVLESEIVGFNAKAIPGKAMLPKNLKSVRPPDMGGYAPPVPYERVVIEPVRKETLILPTRSETLPKMDFSAPTFVLNSSIYKQRVAKMAF